MNAPSDTDSASPQAARDVVRWLTNETRDERFIDNIFAELCVRLQQAGIPVKRATMNLLIHHPQWLGARINWSNGMREAAITRVDYDVQERSEYIGSPVYEVHQGAAEVRERLDQDPSQRRKHALYDELRALGMTDYVAWPLYHTLGKRHAVTFATDRAGGFDDAHVAALSSLLPVLALVSEIRMKNRLARTLLETYVGTHAGELILAGATRRGSGTTVRAAIMICDLRDFTRISDNWPRDDVIDLLNDYFDAMSEPIVRHGGEILKFIGDGLLAIFPLSDPKACANLLKAVSEAREAMAALSEKNSMMGRAPMNYGIGVHVGDVMYGNIGSRSRLDFTVIGPAVNMASRLETLTKQLKRTVLLSRAFADFVDGEFKLEHVGEHPVRGFSEPIELFAFNG
ncbi:adenylate/guanylate cyclase domain-containing protein [Bradyrhizobium tropiciagri]|uniref:adenylate/guanylate cyclase domain-containing protein n=1 Tax=Bradyrhizobium tropiciagri TaxID=312253 RepID=UPI001BA4ED62|nr:adenylate/guanylate cyclase domain-containing protein [Bradyrhizobium tropiciagri]MBR0872912.1 adenylate/guanylate cyclase domain-containing protein [Bradyrhizobium tropiciagri]